MLRSNFMTMKLKNVTLTANATELKELRKLEEEEKKAKTEVKKETKKEPEKAKHVPEKNGDKKEVEQEEAKIADPENSIIGTKQPSEDAHEVTKIQ